MIRQFGAHRAYTCVVSSGRAEKAARMAGIIGPATWHVPGHQAKLYSAALRGEEYRLSLNYSVKAGRNVSQARNHALNAADTEVCLMLDDEIGHRITRLEGDALVRLSFQEAMTDFLGRLAASGLALGALTHITNTMMARNARPEGTRLMINGGCLAVQPTDLRFDEDLLVNEDVDYMLQHWAAYGGALRVNDILIQFGRGTPGGVQVYRDQAVREASVATLVERYPGLVKAHPKDPGHPVLVRARRGLA